MTIIILSNVPPSLRGDLTKWLQQIQPNIFIGTVTKTVRDELWLKILNNIGNGRATIADTTNNELGYKFETTDPAYQVVDFDGIPLMFHQTKIPEKTIIKQKHGFSKASKQYHMRKFNHPKPNQKTEKNEFISLDIETTGLNLNTNKIISISAIKNNGEKFNKFIKINTKIPPEIINLTHITNQKLATNGENLKDVLLKLSKFIENQNIIGYNINFDLKFLKLAYQKENLIMPTIRSFDLEPLVKKDNPFETSYKLENIIKLYDIINPEAHNSLNDAQATLELASKLIDKKLLTFSK